MLNEKQAEDDTRSDFIAILDEKELNEREF